jgi:hypothetical protein
MQHKLKKISGYYEKHTIKRKNEKVKVRCVIIRDYSTFESYRVFLFLFFHRWRRVIAASRFRIFAVIFTKVLVVGSTPSVWMESPVAPLATVVRLSPSSVAATAMVAAAAIAAAVGSGASTGSGVLARLRMVLVLMCCVP